MALFRKSIRLGPLSVNLSRSGVSLSAGIRGARVNVGPRGTYVSLSGGGFQYRRKIDDSAGASNDSSSDDRLATAAAALPETSAEDVIQEIQTRLSRSNWFAVWLTFGVVLSLYALSYGEIAAATTAGVVVILAIPIYRWSSDRRTARLLYDVDDPVLLERFALASAAGEAIASSHRLWHVWWQQATTDRKRNAGASHLIRRTPVRASRGSLPHLESNIEPWSVPIGPQQLLFMPDRLLIREGRRFASVAYDDLDLEADSTQFIEEEAPPRDSQIVGTTWKYVNKSGGPDKRFKDNRQLNILRYGQVVLSSAGGHRVVLNTSNVDAAIQMGHALHELQRPTREVRPPPLRKAVPAKVEPVVMRGGPSEQAFAFAVILKFIATADRRFTEEERRAVIDAVVAQLGGEASVLNAITATVDQIKADAAAVDAAVKQLSDLEAATKSAMVSSAWSIAKADGKITPKERERLQELCSRLAVPPPQEA